MTNPGNHSQSCPSPKLLSFFLLCRFLAFHSQRPLCMSIEGPSKMLLLCMRCYICAHSKCTQWSFNKTCFRRIHRFFGHLQLRRQRGWCPCLALRALLLKAQSGCYASSLLCVYMRALIHILHIECLYWCLYYDCWGLCALQRVSEADWLGYHKDIYLKCIGLKGRCCDTIFFLQLTKLCLNDGWKASVILPCRFNV